MVNAKKKLIRLEKDSVVNTSICNDDFFDWDFHPSVSGEM